MAVKDTKNRYSALNTAAPPVQVVNTVSRTLAVQERSFAGIIAENGKPRLDCEINGEQDALQWANSIVSQQTTKSGWYQESPRKDAFQDFQFGLLNNKFSMARKVASVAGMPVVVEYTGTATEGENILQLEAPPIYNWGVPATIKRTDFVFLEVWKALVAPSTQSRQTIVLKDPLAVVDGDTVDITIPVLAGGSGVAVILTAKNVPVAVTDFLIGATATATATNLATCIEINVLGVTAVATGRLVTVYVAEPGVAGNASTVVCTVAAAGMSPVVPTLFIGGADRPNKPNQSQLYRHGNVDSEATTWLNDELNDPNLRAESSQRIQIQYRIRTTGDVEAVDWKVSPDGFSNPNVMARANLGAPLANYPFVPADKTTTRGNSSAISYGIADEGLWVAGNGSNGASQALGTLDGYVYAIPLGFVFRHNQSEGAGLGFDPVANANGAPTVGHVGYVGALGILILAGHSDRPDGHYCDVIYAEQLLDLRRHIAPAGHNLQSELQYQIQALLDGQNKTWAIDTVDKLPVLGGTSGDVSTQYLVCDNIGRAGVLDIDSDTQGSTPRGTTIRNFDHIARRFGDQPVTERVVFAFWPGDRVGVAPFAPVATIMSDDAATPVTVTTFAPHGLNNGDWIWIQNCDDAALNGRWHCYNVAANTFQIDATGTGVASIGDVYTFGVQSDGKFVAKVGDPRRWMEGDKLTLDLDFIDASTLGSIFSGDAWTSTAGFMPNPGVGTFLPPGTVITDVLSLEHDDGYYGGVGISRTSHVKTVVGLGTRKVEITLDANGLQANSGMPTNNILGLGYNPAHSMVGFAGDVSPASGSERRIFVELEVQYPLGQGLSCTPDLPVNADSTVYATYSLGVDFARNLAVIENNTATRPTDMVNLLGVNFREGLREASLEYEADDAAGGFIIEDTVSRDLLECCVPRRVAWHRFSVVDDLVAGGPAISFDTTSTGTPFGSSSRQVILTGALSSTQTRCAVHYYAQDPVPNWGASGVAYQVSLYYRSDAPQTCGVHSGDFLNSVGGGQLPPLLTVEPLVTSDILYSIQTSVGSQEGTFPYINPSDKVPFFDGSPLVGVQRGTHEEWFFCGTSTVSISDFSANTGMLTLPTFVSQAGVSDLTVGSNGARDESAVLDNEFRVMYPYADPTTYRPTLMSQNLTGAIRHKVFVPMLARAKYDTGPSAARNTTGEDGILFRKNEILLVVLTRYAELDAENNIRFVDTGNTTCAAIYRTKNLLLTVGN